MSAWKSQPKCLFFSYSVKSIIRRMDEDVDIIAP